MDRRYQKRISTSRSTISTATPLLAQAASREDERGEKEYVEPDGVLYNRERDAPGQNCLYVPPGYHDREKYRLGTFAQFPADAPAKMTDLAAAGFYFTGYKDRVKCFSCGIAVENWMQGDDAMDRRWHKADCLMAHGRDQRNVPIPTPNFRSLFRQYTGCDDIQEFAGSNNGIKNYAQQSLQRGASQTSMQAVTRLPNDITDVTSTFRRVQLCDDVSNLVLANVLSTEHETMLKSRDLKSEEERRTTFLKWPSYPAPYLPSDLAKEGFFYLGNLDRTQCFSCSGVLRNWAPYDSVREQHAKHFPNCRIVRQMDSGNLPLTDDQRKDADEAEKIRIAALLPNSDTLVEPPDPSPEEQRHLAQYFPCNEPVNAHMRQLQKRIETFANGWQREKVRASPEAIAKAGFFYLGQSDKTKCYYCNGGLQNWDPNDEPWTEHAKWFPGCEFVLRQKGVDFVRRLAEEHPNLNRPYIRNPVSYDIPPRNVERTSPNHSLEAPRPLFDLSSVEAMGFRKEHIQRAINRKRGGYANAQELIDDLLEESENEDMAASVTGPEDLAPSAIGVEQSIAHGAPIVCAQAGQKREAPSKIADMITKKTRTASPAPILSPEDEKLQKDLKELEKTSLCRVCKQSPSQVVLIPCGHLAACGSCAPGVRRCPICDIKVTSTVKVFRV